MTSATTFRRLHETGLFVMPNAFDAGSAQRLEQAGFEALATTSSGHAATLGKSDQQVTRDELLAHVALLAGAVSVPISVDAEVCFPGEPGGIARTVRLLADAGASGFSIEDFDPASRALVPMDQAVDRVAAAVAAARDHALVVTARCEAVLYGLDDQPEDPLLRLAAYRDAGADVLYAPLLHEESALRALIGSGRPVNVLAAGDHPSLDLLRGWGVRRVSTGGALTWAAYDAAVATALSLRGDRTSSTPALRDQGSGT